MTDERLIIAIGRLERALTRAEAAVARGAGGPADAADMTALTQRHERLRARTQEAIEALDRLIAG